MAQDFDVVSANLLPAATSVTDNDMILIIQSSRVKRALPSAMKGKPGDPGLSPYLGVTENYVQWKQGASGAWQNLIALDNLRGPKGEKPLFRKQGGVLQMKYEGEPNSAYQNIFDREELKLQFSDLTASEIDQLKLHFSDLTEENKAELMKPATDAAATVTQKMTEIEQTVAETIKEVNTAKEAAHTAAERATAAADNVQDGKTPVVVIGSVEDGSEAGASITPAGTDDAGNPKSALNLILPKGATGPAPVLELGTVTTVEPSDPASATFEPSGTDLSGANKYRLDLSIPKGKAGQDGTGAGNVLVGNVSSLLSEKQYAFKPGQDGSVNGSFVEVEATGGAFDLSPFLTADNNTISDEYYNVLQKAYQDKVSTGWIEGDVVPIQISVSETEIGIAISLWSVANFEEREGSDLDLSVIQFIVKKVDKTFYVANGNASFTTRGDGTKALMDNGKYEPVLTEVPSHTLNLSPLFDSNGDPLPTVTDQFIVELKKAYDEKYSNCTAAIFDNAVMPMSIQKTEDGYIIVISSSFSNDPGLAFLSYNFVINTTSKTLSFTPKGAQLETAGDGTKALMDDGQYKAVVEEAPRDSKQYARSNGTWVEVEAKSKNEVVKIILNSNQTQPDNNLKGAKVTVTVNGVPQELSWEGEVLEFVIEEGTTYTVSSSQVEGYATPQSKTYIAVGNNTRNVILIYNTTLTTIDVFSDQDTVDFPSAVDIELTGGITKKLKGNTMYIIKVPTGTSYNISGPEIQWSYSNSPFIMYPAPDSLSVVASGASQLHNLKYKAKKLYISVTTDSGSITPTVTCQIKNGDTPVDIIDLSIASGSSKYIILPSGYKVSIIPRAVDGYITPGIQSYDITDGAVPFVTCEYSFISEEDYSYWVIYDESHPTTILERGGNEAIRDAIRPRFKRCMAMPQANGKAAIAYLNEVASGLWPDDTVSPATKQDAGKYVMVHFPKYYYRNEDLGNERFKYHISEVKINEYYKEERECLVGVFKGTCIPVSTSYGHDLFLCSFSNVEDTGSIPAEDFFASAQKNGSKWGMIDYRIHKTIANMFAIMYGNTNIRDKDENIPCSGGNRGNIDIKNGKTLSLGNRDGSITDSVYTHTSFLGIEDCYTGRSEFMQGINMVYPKWIIYDGGFFPVVINDLPASGATNIRVIDGVMGKRAEFIKKIKHGEYADVAPIDGNGSSTTYYTCAHNSNTGGLYIAARSVNGYYGGVFYIQTDTDTTSNSFGKYYGTRLAFYGEIEVKTPEEWLALTPNFNG